MVFSLWAQLMKPHKTFSLTLLSPGLLACLAYVNVCPLSLPVHLSYTSCPPWLCFCVKPVTPAVLVVTQQGLLKHMYMRWGEDVSDPEMLKAVQTAVRVNRSVKSIRIEGVALRWNNVATAIIEGAAHNTSLMELKLRTPAEDPHPPQWQKIVDKTRQANPKLRLVVEAREYSCT